MKAILGFTRMSVRGLNKVKRELGFVLMALNIRKVVAQRAENNQKFIKRQFLYYFNRNCLFLIQELYVPDSLLLFLVYLLAQFIFIFRWVNFFEIRVFIESEQVTIRTLSSFLNLSQPVSYSYLNLLVASLIIR